MGWRGRLLRRKRRRTQTTSAFFSPVSTRASTNKAPTNKAAATQAKKAPRCGLLAAHPSNNNRPAPMKLRSSSQVPSLSPERAVGKMGKGFGLYRIWAKRWIKFKIGKGLDKYLERDFCDFCLNFEFES